MLIFVCFLKLVLQDIINIDDCAGYSVLLSTVKVYYCSICLLNLSVHKGNFSGFLKYFIRK